MASKKDKLSKAARSEVEKNIGGRADRPSSMPEMVDHIHQDNRNPVENPADESESYLLVEKETKEKKANILVPDESEASNSGGKNSTREPERAPSRKDGREKEKMAKTRDSIYNVSSDIRLEDYTESSSGGGGFGNIGKIVGGLVLLALLGSGIWSIFVWIFGPDYLLAVASHEITAENIEELAKENDVVISAGAPTHIRFQWEEGGLKTDYVKIKIDNTTGDKDEEEAIMARKPPVSANYVYFMGPMDAGEYHIQVLDRDGDILEEKEFRVQ